MTLHHLFTITAAFSRRTRSRYFESTRLTRTILNLPSDNTTAAVHSLARTTGTPDVPAGKQQRGYRFVKDRFSIANLTAEPSSLVNPPRIKEGPVQMEAELAGSYELFADTHSGLKGWIIVFEVKIVKTWVTDALRLEGYENRIDADAWKPMIMSFQNLYGLRNGKLAESTLAKIDEEMYRSPG